MLDDKKSEYRVKIILLILSGYAIYVIRERLTVMMSTSENDYIIDSIKKALME
jgi:hypothetical protein